MLKNVFRVMIYFVGFTVVGTVAAFLLFKVVDTEKTATVPSVTGKSVSEARDIFEAAGLIMEIRAEYYDDTTPPGVIMSQDVNPYGMVEDGSIIGVTVSMGREMYDVPFFEGLDIEDVKERVNQLGMEIGKITNVHSDSVEKNRVITQRPLPGNVTDNKISLVVSSGPYDISYTCPSFTDMTLVEARKTAAVLGLKLMVYDSGRVVIFQKPEAGAIVRKGDTVEITLGRGSGFWF